VLLFKFTKQGAHIVRWCGKFYYSRM